MVGKMSIHNKSTDADFILTIESQDVENMISKDPNHSAAIHGTVSMPGLSSAHLTVSKGQFTLFNVSEGRHHSREMTYRMLLTSNEGEVYYFKGVKVVSKDSAFEIGLGDTTTLNVSLHEGLDDTGEIVGTGRLHIRIKDFVKQLGTMEVTNASNAIQRLKWKAKFGNFFAGCLWEVYGILGSSDESAFDPNAPPREKRPLKLNDVVPEVHQITAADDTGLMLTRYRGGSKGPIMLVHGVGMSSRKFAIDTIETNLVEYLVDHEFDVWLADWRASVKLPSHKAQSTLDDSAKYDIPALVDKVIEVTGISDVQVVGQCTGSAVVFASLLSGQLEGKIRCVIASQTAFQFSSPKSRIKVPFLLSGEGMTAYTDKDTSWTQKLKNQFFESAADLSTAFADHCDNHVCHRVTVMYGQLYDHDNLSKDTHVNMHEQFGFCSVSLLKHLSKCFQKHRLVGADDKIQYLPDFNKELNSEQYKTHMRRLNLPILFISGDDNRVNDPKTLDESYERCKKVNPGQDYQRETSPGYGHMDSIIGKDAFRDVFPKLLPFLEKYAQEGSVPEVVPQLAVGSDFTDSSAYSYGHTVEEITPQTNGNSHVGNGSATKENGTARRKSSATTDSHGWRRKDGMRERSPRSSPRGTPRTSPHASPMPERRESLAPQDAEH